MEKLAQYFFVSGTLTLALALLSYVAEVLLSRQAAPSVLVAQGAGGGEISLEDEQRSGIGRYGTMLTFLAALTLFGAMMARTAASGYGPFANMYDFSISFAFGITFVYLAIHTRYRARVLGLMTLPVALALLGYAATVPSEIQPLVPALQNNSLLTLHVSVAILAYACFAVSFGAGALFLIQERLRARSLPSLESLDEVGFLSAALGFPFMTLVLILGAYWANVAWGRYWGWDPKETASLVTWLLYAGYLHARALRQWRGRRAAILLVIGFVAVMLTYFGNYFLGGLHSYT